MAKEELRIAENNIYESLKKSFPSFISICRINGSSSPYDDAYDLQNDLFLKLREHIYKPQNIRVSVKELKNTKMYYHKQKGRAEAYEEEGDSIDIVQGKLLNLSFENETENTVSISIDSLSKNIIKKEEDNIEYILNEIQINDRGEKKQKNNELFLNNESIKPNSLHINVYPVEYTIQRSAKNLAIDQHSSKNKRNKELIDIVIEPGSYKKDVMEQSSGYKEKEDDSNILPLPKNLSPEESIKKNEDDIIENNELKRKAKMVEEYIKNNMDPKTALAMHYWKQDISGKEMALLMGETAGNVRKLIYKGRLELVRAISKKIKE